MNSPEAITDATLDLIASELTHKDADSNPLAGTRPRNWCNQWSGFFNGALDALEGVDYDGAPGMVMPMYDTDRPDDKVTADLVMYALNKWSAATGTPVEHLRPGELAAAVRDTVRQFAWQARVESEVARVEAAERGTAIEEASSIVEAVDRELAHIDVTFTNGTTLQVKNTDSRPTFDDDADYDELVWVTDDDDELEYEIIA